MAARAALIPSKRRKYATKLHRQRESYRVVIVD
jgi:hypothetical protein